MTTIAIIGAGAFGTALAAGAAQNHTVILYARDAARVHTINTTRRNETYLPGITLPAGVTATADMAAIASADAVLLTTPVQTTRDILHHIAPYIRATTPLIACGKGLEQASGLRLDEVITSWRADQRFALLSGPNFAGEIAAGKPSAAVIAAPVRADAEALCALLATSTFRPYAQDDVIGVALAGALKNPLAIGAGIIDGAGLGENARAAFLTRGVAEIARLGLACGARAETFMGLAGLGDVLLTCTSNQSRNHRYGVALARNEPPAHETVEGLPTIIAALHLGERHAVELPLMRALHALCHEHQPLRAVLDTLFARPLKGE